jgi:hypothetical protein
MRRRTFLTGTAALGSTLLLSQAALAQRGGGFEFLGASEVSFKVDRDTIRVGRKDGKFRAIQLRVKKRDIEILDLKVVYANGQPDDISVRSLIRAGGETRQIDLAGRERFIREVQLTYRARTGPFQSARVELWGLK